MGVSEEDGGGSKRTQSIGLQRTTCENAIRSAQAKLADMTDKLKTEMAAVTENLTRVHGINGTLQDGPLQAKQDVEKAVAAAVVAIETVIRQDIPASAEAIKAAETIVQLKNIAGEMARFQKPLFEG